MMFNRTACMTMATVPVLLSLAACSSSPPVDDAPFIAQQSFSTPLIMRVNAALVNQGDPGMMALWKAGLIQLSPKTDAAPWLAIKGPDGSGAQEFPVLIGTREIESRTDKRSWTESSVQFYAETIQYHITPDAHLKSILSNTFGPYGLRLIFSNNPRDGVWQLTSAMTEQIGGTTPIDDSADIRSAFSAAGLQASTEFQGAVIQTKLKSYDLIEKDLSDKGVIAKGPSANTLISKKFGLAFYLAPEATPAFKTEPLKNVVYHAAQMCAQLKIPNFGSWRLPTYDNIRAVSDQDRFVTWRQLYDTPDQRIWGSFSYHGIDSGGQFSPVADPPNVTWGPFNVIAFNTSLHVSEVRDFDDIMRPIDGTYGRLMCVSTYPRKA